MNVTLHLHDEFKRQFRRLSKKYRSLIDDLEIFGKRGGLRIITLNVVVETTDTCINLLTIYDKNEIDNVSDEYIKWLVSGFKK